MLLVDIQGEVCEMGALELVGPQLQTEQCQLAWALRSSPALSPSGRSHCEMQTGVPHLITDGLIPYH